MVMRVNQPASSTHESPSQINGPVTYEVTETMLADAWQSWYDSPAGKAEMKVARSRYLRSHIGMALVALVFLYAGLRLWMLGEQVMGALMTLGATVFLITLTRGWAVGPTRTPTRATLETLRRSGHLDAMIGRLTSSIGPSGLLMRAKHHQTLYPWSAVRAIKRQGRLIAVELKYSADFGIPVSAFESDAAADRWAAQCESFRRAFPDNLPDPVAVRLKDADFNCPSCGYNLRGTPGGVCPECGWMVDLVP